MSDQSRPNLNCEHCGGEVTAGDKNCSHCGIPLPPDFGKNPRKKFVLFFIALIVFCVVMIIWLPRLIK
jgi:predicted amidophosphoribosyltransferase